MNNFNTGEIVFWIIMLIGAVFGYSYAKEILKNLFERSGSLFRSNKLKNAVLVACVYVIALFCIDYLDGVSPTYSLNDQQEWLLAIPFTIVIIFLYNKLSKRFSL